MYYSICRLKFFTSLNFQELLLKKEFSRIYHFSENYTFYELMRNKLVCAKKKLTKKVNSSKKNNELIQQNKNKAKKESMGP
jgi:hypothetical protein